MAINATTHSEQLNVQALDLLAGVSTHGDQHLAEVERDLVQMNTLLDEAIKKLCSSFMAIHAAVGKQQEAMGAATARVLFTRANCVQAANPAK